MRPITTIRNATIRGREGLHDLHLRDGRLERLEPVSTSGVPADRSTMAPDVLDAEGMLVIPRFVDPHVHLDLAYTFDPSNPNRSGTLVEAIRLWRETKAHVTRADTTRRACLAIADEVRHGVGLIRTHVDVASSSGLRLVEGVLDARERAKALVDIEVVAFPQDGLVQDPDAIDNLRQAMRLGCDVVGGIAHNERTPGDSVRHVEMLFDLAAEFDAPI
ncbi:MAG: amidohydrolase family protein, partial [Phycisphaerales bacterium]|nr:amidohydrolase family protein [Phycisphaerales bacterium]